MKDVEIIDLIEKLRVMQQKANELAGHQLEMTQHLESAFKKARALTRRCESLPQLRQQRLDAAAIALDHRGEFVALRHLHAHSGDIDVGDLITAILLDNVPVQPYRPARKDDFAVDHSFRSL